MFDESMYDILAQRGVVYRLATGVRALSTPIRYADLRFVVVDWVRKIKMSHCVKTDGSIDNLGDILRDTLEAATMCRPRQAPSYDINDGCIGDENYRFAKLFLEEQIRIVKELSTGNKISTDRLRERVGGRATTAMSLDEVMERFSGMVDRADAQRWGVEVVQ
jgi:hypothetical protein